MTILGYVLLQPDDSKWVFRWSRRRFVLSVENPFESTTFPRSDRPRRRPNLSQLSIARRPNPARSPVSTSVPSPGRRRCPSAEHMPVRTPSPALLTRQSPPGSGCGVHTRRSAARRSRPQAGRRCRPSARTLRTAPWPRAQPASVESPTAAAHCAITARPNGES